VETVYCTNIPEAKTIPSSGIVTSLVDVAEATEPTFKREVPAGVVVVKLNVPAVPEQTIDSPCIRDLPAKTTSPAEAFTPAETLPAGLPTAAI
jgi:hypothetical protein